MGTEYKGNADHYHKITENLDAMKESYPYNNGMFGAHGDSKSNSIRHITSDDPQKTAKEFDYYGAEEDVAVLSVEKECYPAVNEKNFISTPVNSVVQKVLVVQEEQKLSEGGKTLYDVKLTRGIILEFGDYQISFEKAVWFSEDIIIRKGYDLIDKFSAAEKLCKKDNWQENMKMQCSRTIDFIK